MRCHICNIRLEDGEGRPDKVHGGFEPCGICKEEVNAVFDDFVPEEEMFIDPSVDVEQVSDEEAAENG